MGTPFEIALRPDRPKKRSRPISAGPSASRAISKADGPRARIAPAIEETKQEGRGVDCGAGLDAKAGGGGSGGGGGDGGDSGGSGGCRPCFPFFFDHGSSSNRSSSTMMYTWYATSDGPRGEIALASDEQAVRRDDCGAWLEAWWWWWRWRLVELEVPLVLFSLPIYC